MTPKPITENTLFYGDNLPILREYVPDESVDLVYLDPPFNSQRTYNVLFKDESGKVGVRDVRDLRGTVEREKAALAACRRKISGTQIGADKELKSACISVNLRPASKETDFSDSLLGVLITLEPPTRDMETEAVAAGFYHSPVWQRDYPRLQLLTVEQLLAGARIEMPPDYGTFKRAERVVQVEEVQGRLEL